MQYSAQPLPQANLLQQGAGLLDLDGVVVLAKALRTDLETAIGAGTAGATLLAAGKSMPMATLSGWLVSSSGLVFSEDLVLSEGFVLGEPSRRISLARAPVPPARLGTEPGPARSNASDANGHRRRELTRVQTARLQLSALVTMRTSPAQCRHPETQGWPTVSCVSVVFAGVALSQPH